MLMLIYDHPSYIKASGKVTTDGENYVFYNVERKMVTKANIDSSDTSKVNIEKYEPSESTPFLAVPVSLVFDTRDDYAADEKMNAKEKRQRWIESQF